MAVLWEAEGEAERVLRERRAFRTCLAALAEPTDGIDAAELIYGELVANTVRHANGAVKVRLELDDHDPRCSSCAITGRDFVACRGRRSATCTRNPDAASGSSSCSRATSPSTARRRRDGRRATLPVTPGAPPSEC